MRPGASVSELKGEINGSVSLSVGRKAFGGNIIILPFIGVNCKAAENKGAVHLITGEAGW